MKRVWIIVLFALAGVFLIVKNEIFEQQTPADQIKTNQTTTKSENKITSSTATETKTWFKVGKEDSILYSDADLTHPQATINGGELTEYVTETADAYQVTTNEGESGYLALSEGEKVTTSVKETPTSLSNAVIVLDPGHGGEDTGALSNDEQVEEKTITLSTAKKVKAALEEAGATVYLTRSTDELIQLDDICAYSESKKADVFISLHADSTENANEATGITTYYYYNDNEKLAQTVATSFESLPLESRGIATGNYQVLRENFQPAILIEMGYMNNDSDLAELTSNTYQKKIAENLTSALKNYFSQS
ncbi:cell wall hydrolase [Enterococcus villorum]|uniref:Cell wall hydrolase n=1 Tax=Enterococcus villorum TaxID=112904 RepID=A0A1V8YC39_9ENTE|nr:N-acetylmuramoyl-L-alanine amidase [Enterococcus villorum]OQO70187.1 cell wall hydrolase [Enterococcus villorum]OQO72220.1 cell wall hydrolase [Enterococcus villorum]